MNPASRMSFGDFWTQQLRRVQAEYNRACLTGRMRIRSAVALQYAQSLGLTPPYPDWFIAEVAAVGPVYLGGG